MTKTKLILSIALVLCLATIGAAQDKAKGKGKAGGDDKAQAVKQATTQMMKAFEAANLTDEQKEKAVAIIEKHADSIVAAKKAVDEMLTKDQLKAKTAAAKKAKEDGLKGAKATEAVNAALGLSDEKLAAYKEATKKSTEVMAKVKDAIAALLTDEQKASMPAAKGKGKGKKKKDGGDN